MEIKNSKTGMAHEEMKQFIRNHFEEFVNKQNLAIADVNFAPDFVDHGADVPPGTAPGIEDLAAENDKVVVRNHWTGTDAKSGLKIQFRGIVIWRIQDRKIAERWAYLEAPHPA